MGRKDNKEIMIVITLWWLLWLHNNHHYESETWWWWSMKIMNEKEYPVKLEHIKDN